MLGRSHVTSARPSIKEFAVYKLSLLKSVREKTPKQVTARNFLEQHRRVEAYLRRLILIALRQKGVTYRRARSEAEAV